jgi:hypothetical protein
MQGVKMKCEYCGSELPDKVKTVIIGKYEYEISHWSNDFEELE